MQAFDSLCLFSCHRNGVWYLQGASHLWTPFSSPAACVGGSEEIEGSEDDGGSEGRWRDRKEVSPCRLATT